MFDLPVGFEGRPCGTGPEGDDRRIRQFNYFPLNHPFGRLTVIEDDFAPSQELLYTPIDSTCA